jgi:L-glyceraldehyde reductase
VAFRYSTTTIQPVDEKTGLIDVIDVPIKDTWAAMEALVAKGKVRSIGVSNFTRRRIEELLKTYAHCPRETRYLNLTYMFRAKIPPAVNQIEAHPYLQQRELLEWSKEKVNERHTYLITTTKAHNSGHSHNRIFTTRKQYLQHSSVSKEQCIGIRLRLTSERTVDDPLVIEVAKSLNRTPAQVLISWAVQRGTAVLPKSVTPERIKSNFQGSFVVSYFCYTTIRIILTALLGRLCSTRRRLPGYPVARATPEDEFSCPTWCGYL